VCPALRVCQPRELTTRPPATPEHRVVTKTSDKSVSVAFDGDVDDERLLALRSADGGAVRLDVLPNDASHRKVLRALDQPVEPASRRGVQGEERLTVRRRDSPKLG